MFQFSIFVQQATPKHSCLRQKPLFVIFCSSVAWLGSVQWFICSVWCHLGCCRHLKTRLGRKAQMDHTHGWQLVLTVTRAQLCCWLTASVLLFGSLHVMWASHSMAARFWEETLQEPASRNNRSLKVMSQKWHSIAFSAFCRESGKIFGAICNPLWCIFQLYTYARLYPSTYLPMIPADT